MGLPFYRPRRCSWRNTVMQLKGRLTVCRFNCKATTCCKYLVDRISGLSTEARTVVEPSPWNAFVQGKTAGDSSHGSGSYPHSSSLGLPRPLSEYGGVSFRVPPAAFMRGLTRVEQPWHSVGVHVPGTCLHLCKSYCPFVFDSVLTRHQGHLVRRGRLCDNAYPSQRDQLV